MNSFFRHLLLALALVLPFATAHTADKNPAQRPSVLFILCDDIRWNAMSCAGHPSLKTPNIDRIANEGVRFANMFCTTSLCSPSRASILTGLCAHAHGVVNNFTELPATLTHWPMRLRESGYETAYMGKWHMGEENDSPRAGFDFFATHKGQGKYFDTEWNVNGAGAKKIEGYYTTVVTDMALDWLKKDHSGKPWALCVGHKAPHSFYTPEEKYAHTFDDVRVKYPDTAFHLDDKPAWMKDRLHTWHGIYGPLFEWRKKFPDDRPEAVKDFENMVHGYWGTILSVDDSIGRMFKFLEDTKQLDHTILVFMGDNGLLEGEHGMVDKRTAHEPSLRIPLLVRYPGLAQRKVIDGQVLTIDVAPSLLAYTWGFQALPMAMDPGLRQHVVEWGAFVCFLFLLCGAGRLARFNISVTPLPANPGRPGRKYFVGMPIPAAAGVIAAVVHFFLGTPVPNWRVAIMWMLLVLLIGLLMVSTWRFWSGKEIDLSDRHPFQRIVLMGLAIYATVAFSQYVLLALAAVYMFSGIFARAAYSWQRRHRRMPTTEAVVLSEPPSQPPVHP